jgi:predicted 3-demethylubiquinone-9 3-methyltransferase (glyoxalase superfamily)
MTVMKKITPFLWFNGKAEEAANYYVSIFPNSKILNVVRGGEDRGPQGSVSIITFSLNGDEFMALNGGPEFAFSSAISFMAVCQSQAEVDGLWAKLAAGGEEDQCGWLRDKFGVTWQVVPEGIEQVLYGPDHAGSLRAFQAMLKMKKLDLAALKQAYEGGWIQA